MEKFEFNDEQKKAMETGWITNHFLAAIGAKACIRAYLKKLEVADEIVEATTDMVDYLAKNAVSKETFFRDVEGLVNDTLQIYASDNPLGV